MTQIKQCEYHQALKKKNLMCLALVSFIITSMKGLAVYLCINFYNVKI